MGINRINSRKPHRGKGWCDICDACIISAGMKCPNCGHRDKPSRNKRELTTTGNIAG